MWSLSRMCALIFVLFKSVEAQEDPLIHYPCELEGFYLARRTVFDSWWAARLYLTDFSHSSTIRLTVKTDKTGIVELDPRMGYISGPNIATIFHLNYFGSPANVSYVEFKVSALESDEFPNLKELELNNRELCRDAKEWVNNEAERRPSYSTSLLGGFLTSTATPHHSHNHGVQRPRPISNEIGAMSIPQGHRPHGDPSPDSGEETSQAPRRPSTTTQSSRPILAGIMGLTTMQTQRPAVTPKPYLKPSSVSHGGVGSETCGRRFVHTQGFITNGWQTKPGDWPWHSAVYHRHHRSSSYKCGGTLLSAKAVLTAAHCMFAYGKMLVPDRLSVQLGKFDLDRFDSNSEEYDVYEVVVHPTYSTSDFRDDIALLLLAELVTFNSFIRPACLWPQSKTDLSFVVNHVGVVVGWGLNEKNVRVSLLNEATMPVVDFHTCLESDRDFFGLFLSEYNFCAGFNNGTSVCQGDSGGGLFFNHDDTWYIRGLVSHGTVIQGTNLCNPRNFVIFTDVAKYRNWIVENW